MLKEISGASAIIIRGTESKNVISSFAPFVAAQTRLRPHLLILGSMPGEESLRQQSYYAHPRNAFWPIMARLIGFAAELDYQKRLAALGRAKIALWDVLQHCERKGSLDGNIKNEAPNDIIGFLEKHQSVRAVFLNGGFAAKSFRRHIFKHLPRALIIYDLPSTSPAHARLKEEDKFLIWQKAWKQFKKKQFKK